ncbi:MAG: alpha/beta fold hydrolase [Pseudomonadota bacterium]
MNPRNFVLVHGAWHGGWCWSRVAEILCSRGHRVTAPTQTGLGERSHLLTDSITLQTFVDDIIQHVNFEELNEVVFVGHSYGGISITGVADQMPGCVSKLIFLDAVLLDSGETWFDFLPTEVIEKRKELAMETSGGLSVPPPSAEAFGVQRPDDIAFLASRLTPHPINTYRTNLTLENRIGNGLPASYVSCTEPRFDPVTVSLNRAQDFGWPITQIATGHDAMVTEPQAVADLLEELAG